MTERTKVALFLTTQHTVYEKAAEGEQDGLVNVFKAFCSTKPYIGHKIILEDVPIDPTTKRIPLFPVLLGCLRIIVQSSLDVDHPLALRLGQGVNCWYGNQLMPKYIAGQKALGSKSEGILPLILADEDHPVTEDVRNGAQQIFVAGGNEALIDTHPCGSDMRWSLLNRKEANHFVIISLPPAQVYCSNNKFLLMRTCKQEAQMLFDLMKAGYITAADWLTDISQIYKIQLQAHQSLINRRMVGTLTTAATKLDEIITNQSDVESVKSSKPRSSKEDNDSGIEISDDVYGQDTLSVSSKQLASVRVMQMRYNTKLDDETSSRSRSDSKGDESVNPTFVNHAQVVNLLDQLLSCAPATHVTKPTTINNSTMRSSSSTLQTHKMSVNTAGNTNKQQEYHWRQDASDPLPPPIHLPMTSTSSTKPPHEGFHTISQISSLDSDCRELHMSHVDVQDVWQSQQMEVEPMKGSVSGKKHSRQLTLDLSSIDRASRPRISSHPSIPMGSLAYALKSTDENYEIMDLSQFDVFHPLDCKLMLQRHLFTGIPDHVEGDTHHISTSNSSEVGTNSTFVAGSSRLVAAAHTFVNALRFSKQYPDKILCEVADVANQKQPARVNRGTVEDENKSIVCNLKQVKIHYKYFLLELTPSDIEDFE